MSPLYGCKMPGNFRVEFVRHKSARSIVLAYFRYDHPRMRIDRLLAMETDFHVLLGKRWAKPALVSEIVEVVKSVGVWGYCNHRSRHVKEVHYWVAPHAKRINVMEFVLHEVAHAGGFRTEKMACKVAGLGSFAYGVFESIFSPMIFEKSGASPGKPEYNHQHGKDQDIGLVRRGRRAQNGVRESGEGHGGRDQVRRCY